MVVSVNFHDISERQEVSSSKDKETHSVELIKSSKVTSLIRSTPHLTLSLLHHPV